MSTYPQLGNASMGSPAGVAARVRQLERQMKAAKVAGGKIEDDSVQGGKIKGGTITSAQIQAGSITAELISAGAINAGHIQANVITAGHIAANTITAGQIAASTITAGQIAASTITAAQIAASTITAAQIASDTITAQQIAANAITTSELAANSVTSDKIVAGTIAASDIAASTITGALIAAATITATNIAASTITGSLIASATIAGTNLISETITATQIAAGAITTPKLLATAIDGMTITGALVRSGASGARWEGSTTGLRGYNSANELTFAFDTATGKVSTLVGVGGINILKNARFAYWPSGDSPWGWAHYDNGGNTATWSKVAGGGPIGQNAWRLQITSSGSNLGFQTSDTYVFKGNKTYVQSWLWKGNRQPQIVSNTSFTSASWIENPTASTTEWKRYAYKVTYPSGGGGLSGGTDYVYVMPSGTLNGSDVYLTDVQFEEGDIHTVFGPKPDEILPSAVGSEEIQDGSVRGGGNEIAAGTISATDIVANTITAGQIAASTITATQIAANTITAGKIAAGTITATQIAAGTITATQIATATITSDRIASRTIAADRIAAHVISAYEINATSGGGNLIDNAGLGAGLTTTSSGNMALGTLDTYEVVAVDEPAFDRSIRVTLTSDGSPHVYFGWTFAGGFKNRVVPGRRYSFSAYFKSSVSRTCRVTIQFMDSGGNVLSGLTVANPEASIVSENRAYRNTSSTTSTFIRSQELWAEAPANAHFIRPYVQYFNGLSGETVHFAGIQLEEGDLRTNFSASPARGTFTGQVFRTDIPGKDRYELTNSGLVKIKADNVTKPVELGLTDGLDILQGVNDLVPPTDRQLRWKNATEATATIYSVLDSPGIKNIPSLIIRSTTTVLDKEVKALLGAYNNHTTSRGEVSIECNWAPADANATLIARAEAQNVTVLAADGKSDLIQAKGAGLAAIRGEVSAAGAIIEGTGFTVVRNSLGNYTVTYTVGTVFNANATPIVTASSTSGATQATAHIYARSASAFSYVTAVSGARNDVAANFVVFGPVKPI